MDCTKCESKGCRSGAPCTSGGAEYLNVYRTDENRSVVKAASSLVDGGRAGTLTRLEEIAEYCRLRGYKKIGVAYCYALEKQAASIKDFLIKEGLSPVMVSCTVDGISESDIDPDKTETAVSCNPLGQAEAINQSGAQFAVLVGLCLGHDVLLQKALHMDFTVFAVKDRVTGHNPLLGLPGAQAIEDAFLLNMPGGFHLMGGDEFLKMLEAKKSPEDFYLLDLRGKAAFADNGIPGSINITLSSLPQKYRALLPDKSKEVIAVCGGGLQSLYAVMYLSMKGYKNVRSIKGGFPDFGG